MSDADLLDLLRSLLAAQGSLSSLVIDEREDMPSSSVYRNRFGSLLRAYHLVGDIPRRDYRYIEINRRLRAMHPDVGAMECLVMSLVENCARRQHRSVDLLQDVATLRKRGYTDRQIGEKIGTSPEWVNMMATLIEKGEQRLVEAVDTGTIPISVAIEIARADDEAIQQMMAEAYTEGRISAPRLIKMRRLIEQRTRRGKYMPTNPFGKKLSKVRTSEAFEADVDRRASRPRLRAAETGRLAHEARRPQVDHWLADRDGKVKPNTLAVYKVVVEDIRGPCFDGPAKDKLAWKVSGKLPKGCRLVLMLGEIKTSELTTARIRAWHRELTALSGQYTANRAKSHLISILALDEEDYRVRAPSMPRGLGRNRVKAKKVILTPAEVGKLVEADRGDPEHGLYYAFPFLAGTRPSEQLGLLWDDVDFDANVIRICRIQERDGSLTNMTKTEARTRDIPMSAILRALLLEWRVRCPRLGKQLHRVFPGPGRLQPWPKVARIGGRGARRLQP